MATYTPKESAYLVGGNERAQREQSTEQSIDKEQSIKRDKESEEKFFKNLLDPSPRERLKPTSHNTRVTKTLSERV